MFVLHEDATTFISLYFKCVLQNVSNLIANEQQNNRTEN